MTRAWSTVLLLGAVTMCIKALGPLVLGARVPSPRTLTVLDHLAPAVFAALIANQVFVSGTRLTIDARLGGLVVAVIGAARRVPPSLVLAAAVLVTAALRL